MVLLELEYRVLEKVGQFHLLVVDRQRVTWAVYPHRSNVVSRLGCYSRGRGKAPKLRQEPLKVVRIILLFFRTRRRSSVVHRAAGQEPEERDEANRGFPLCV